MTTETIATTDSTATAWTVETATIAITTRPANSVLTVSKKNPAIVHSLKMDKDNRPRSLCGVPIGTNGGMLKTEAAIVSCPTCVSAVAKGNKPAKASNAIPAATTPAAAPVPASTKGVPTPKPTRQARKPKTAK